MNETKLENSQAVPPLYKNFYGIRLVMTWLITSAYFYIIPDSTSWKYIVLWTSLVILTISHSMFRFLPFVSESYYFIPIGIDFLVATCLGFLIPGFEHPYPIYYGMNLITLILAAKTQEEIRRGIYILVGVWVLLSLYTFMHVQEFAVTDLLNFGFVIFCYFAGKLIRHYQQAQDQIRTLYRELDQSHQSLQATHEQLQSYAKQVEELTAAHEQNRIAREIHDTVGHTMTALFVQLQVARKLIHKDQSKAEEALRVSEELAQSAMQDIRTAVRAMKENVEPSSFLVSIKKLLQEFSQISEVKTYLEVEGDVSDMGTSLQSALYRIVQESLTNAKRHGQATEARVTIQNTGEQIKLSIYDNGVGANDVVPSFGLKSMRERIYELGGSIQFSSVQGAGFQVNIHIPLKQQVWNYGG